MFFDRIASKQRAKEIIRTARPSPILVTLVFTLLTPGIANLVGMLAINPFSQAMTYIMQGYDPLDVYGVVFGGGGAMVSTFVSILIGLYTTIVFFGFTGYLLRLSRREEGSFGNLISGFNMAVKVVLLDLVSSLFIALWCLLFIIPGIIAAYRYSQAIYILLDNPDIGVMEALRRSKILMLGQKGNLFFLQLTFVGWTMLAGGVASVAAVLAGYPGTVAGVWVQSIVVGIFGLWLTPYMGIVTADFYNNLIGWTEGTNTAGGYRGPELEF